MGDYRVISKSHPPVDSLAKVTGQIKFISDIRLPGMLWGQVVRSPYPHARIREIRTDKALRVPGVKAVVTSADTPRIPFGPFIPDWQILAVDKVTFAGQEVAAVAALHYEAAVEGARAIEVEYEELPAVLDPEESLRTDAPRVRDGKENNVAATFSVERGDVDRAFSQSAFVRQEVFYTPSAFHAYLEPNGCIAEYDAATDSYLMRAATQVPYKARCLYANALGIGWEKLRLIQSPMGGAFGGKFESNFHLVAACLAKKTCRPVRLVNTMAEEFFTAPLRVPLKITLKIGLTREGSITGKEVEVLADNGGRTHYGPAVLATACYRVDSMYRIFNTRSRGSLVYTNTVPKGAMRGFGNAEMLFAVESLLDMIAEDAGLDPGDLRKRNAFKNGEKTVHGWVIGSCGLPECVDKAQQASGWREKRRRVSSPDGNKRRGIGLACCNHVSGYRPILKDFDGSSAMVKVGPAPRVTVFTGEVDMGQGYNTVAAQCAAEELGLPLQLIEIAPVDSFSSVLGIGSLASRATLMGGNAVKEAARSAGRLIMAAAAMLYGRDARSLVFSEGVLVDRQNGETLGEFQDIISKLTNLQAGQPFIGTGYYRPDTVLPDPKTQYGNPSPAYSFGAHVAEVEVDLETGQVTVVNYTGVNDVGKAINPLLAKGQIEGGVLQGLGWTLTERLVEEKGCFAYTDLLDYKIPTIAEMPQIQALLVEEEDPNGPYGAKSLGEPTFNPVAAAIANAIHHAVGFRATGLPITQEDLRKAIRKKRIGVAGKEGA
jgi:CO/xanthine dehydrogenase Mo-binding subunit